MRFEDLPGTRLDSGKTTSVLMFIIDHLLAEQHMPQNVSEAALARRPSPRAFLLMVNAIL